MKSGNKFTGDVSKGIYLMKRTGSPTMKLIKAIPIIPCGIKLHGLFKRKNGTWYNREIRWGKANHHFVEIMNPALEELADHGTIALYTYGIRCNRLIRGSSTTTSTHSNGLASTGYKHWRDGSVGALGIDIRKVLFENTSSRLQPCNPAAAHILTCGLFKGSSEIIQTSLVVTDPGDLKNMIQWLENRDFKLYHKRINSCSPYHIHAQPMNLKARGIT